MLKCCYGDDIRVVEIQTDITFEQLQETIFSRFGGKQLNITYKDEEGDYITIDSLALLQKTANSQLASGAKAVKLFLFDRPSSVCSPKTFVFLLSFTQVLIFV